MEIDVQPGRYVVAVSGGVDSMALLHLLQNRPGVELVVAHFDHGIREDSYKDRLLVEHTAEQYGLPHAVAYGGLGPKASEATARDARYAFLEHVRRDHRARAIITAHHQDDVLETVIFNLLRGTGRKGLTSLASNPQMLRPLLGTTKQDLRNYAKANSLKWREDSTNANDIYTRNYIRRQILPRFNVSARARLLAIIEATHAVNRELDIHLANAIHMQEHPNTLDRRAFITLPHAVAKELLASWLRARGIANFDAKTLERVTVAAKTYVPGAIIDVVGGAKLHVTKSALALDRHER